MEHIITKLVQEFERGKMTRRQLIQNLTLAATAASVAGTVPPASAAGTGLTATHINHISYEVADYARTRDFYAEMFGMKVSDEDPKRKQVHLSFGDPSYLYMVIRTLPADAAVKMPHVDHMRLVIGNWNKDVLLAELKRRGVPLLPEGGEGETQFNDPDGLRLQVSGEG